MLLEGDGSTREPFKPPPARRLPVPAKPAASPQKRLGPVAQPQAPAQQQDFFHVSPEQQQQQFAQIAPARSNIIDILEGSQVSDLLKPKKPLAVEIVPKQPVIQAVEDGGWMDGTFPVSPWVVDKEFTAQSSVDQKDKTAQIAQRNLRRKAYEEADQPETAQALTPQQWASLSPLQQAAAQSNYDLAQAVKKDFDTQGKYKADASQTKNYQSRLTELFGEEEALGFKGLDYAPNTIAFLDSRGIEAANLVGRTLDDVISGKSLMSTDTFNALGEEVKSPDVLHNAPADARGQNIQFAQDLAKGQLAYQEGLATKLKQGNQLLTDITSASTTTAAHETYGAQEPVTRVKLTDVRPEVVAQFDMYMEALARTDSPIDQALEAINLDLGQRGASATESAQVWEGLIERSRQAVTGEGKWFGGLDFPMRSPVEVAQALGAPTLKRQATLGAR